MHLYEAVSEWKAMADRSIATVPRACCTPETGACVCPAEEVLEALARSYALVVLSLLAEHGRLRFSDLKARVHGATAKTLTARLRELENAGLVARKEVAAAPPRVEYRLTSRGEHLLASMEALFSWAEGEGLST